MQTTRVNTEWTPGTLTVARETADIAALCLEGEWDLATHPISARRSTERSTRASI